jgi:hypothetical protein
MVFFPVVVASMTVSIYTSCSATPIIMIMVMFKQLLYYIIIPTRRRQRSHAQAVLLPLLLLVVAHVAIVEHGEHRFDHGLEKQALALGRLPVLSELLLV